VVTVRGRGLGASWIRGKKGPEGREKDRPAKKRDFMRNESTTKKRGKKGRDNTRKKGTLAYMSW